MNWAELKAQIDQMTAAEQRQAVRLAEPTHARQVMWLALWRTTHDVLEGEDPDRGTAIPAGEPFLAEETLSMAELDSLLGLEDPAIAAGREAAA